MDVVEHLLSSCNTAEEINIVNASTTAALTPFHAAILGNQAATVSKLIQKNAAITQQTASGLAPLHIATLLCYPDLVTQLLTTPPQPLRNPNTPDSENRTALHYAASKCDSVLTDLLLTHGAQPEIEDNYGKKPIDYATCQVIQRKLRQWVNLIQDNVKYHMLAAPDEDPSTQPKIISAINPHLGIEGIIPPSLQQTRPDRTVTGMCAYYALYNAICLTDEQRAITCTERINREAFAQFLTQALSSLRQIRPSGDLENLTSDELRALIAQNYPTQPIIVIEKDALLYYINNEHNTSLEEILGIDEAHNYLRQFIEQKCNKIALIVGIGSDKNGCGTLSGHWFTIVATRENDKVHVGVADSTRQSQAYDEKSCILNVLPLYLALTNSINNWKSIFTKNLQREIFVDILGTPATKLQRANDTGPVASKIKSTLQPLENLIESIHQLNEMLAIFAEDKLPEPHLNKKNIFLVNHYLTKFAHLVDDLLPTLLAFGIRQKAIDPLGDQIINFHTFIIDNIQTLARAIERIHSTVDREPLSCLKLQKIICIISERLRKIERQALQIDADAKASAVQHNDIDENMNDFVISLEPLNHELFVLVMNAAPRAIQGLIGMVLRERKEPLRILFVGPPGNGKTTLAQAIAQQTGRPCIFVSTSGLGTRFQYSREEQLNKLKRYIKKNPKSVIIFDEIDSIRESKDEAPRTAEMLQVIIDSSPETLFIGTTNYKDQLPAPLLSRFSQNVIKIDNPDEAARLGIIQHYCTTKSQGNLCIGLSEKYKQQLAKATASFSIRDISSMFTKAIQEAYIPVGKSALSRRDAHNTEHQVAAACINTSMITVTQKHMEAAFASEYETISTKFSKLKFALTGLEILTGIGVGIAAFTPYAPVAVPAAQALHVTAKIARAGHAYHTAEGKDEEIRREAELNQTLRDASSTAAGIANSELAHQRQTALHKKSMERQEAMAEDRKTFDKEQAKASESFKKHMKEDDRQRTVELHNVGSGECTYKYGKYWPQGFIFHKPLEEFEQKIKDAGLSYIRINDTNYLIRRKICEEHQKTGMWPKDTFALAIDIDSITTDIAEQIRTNKLPANVFWKKIA